MNFTNLVLHTAVFFVSCVQLTIHCQFIPQDSQHLLMLANDGDHDDEAAFRNQRDLELFANPRTQVSPWSFIKRLKGPLRWGKRDMGQPVDQGLADARDDPSEAQLTSTGEENARDQESGVRHFRKGSSPMGTSVEEDPEERILDPIEAALNKPLEFSQYPFRTYKGQNNEQQAVNFPKYSSAKGFNEAQIIESSQEKSEQHPQETATKMILRKHPEFFFKKRLTSPEHFTYINDFAGDIMLRQSRPRIQPLRWG